MSLLDYIIADDAAPQKDKDLAISIQNAITLSGVKNQGKGNCETGFNGDLNIGEIDCSNIVELASGWNNLNSVTGTLYLSSSTINTYEFTSLNNLSNLTNVTENLFIEGGFNNLNGLGKLSNVQWLFIYGPNFNSFQGLNKNISLNYLTLTNVPNLTTLSSLYGYKNMSQRLYIQEANLANLNGIENGAWNEIQILTRNETSNNQTLTDISALDNLIIPNGILSLDVRESDFNVFSIKKLNKNSNFCKNWTLYGSVGNNSGGIRTLYKNEICEP